MLQQERKDRNKPYSLHEPEVICIRPGKADKKYKNKLSIAIMHKKDFILSAKSHSNHPYDAHTLNGVRY
ncbi:MAG: hypothetical protein HAW62_01625 [Endozoicomonadaceae bacterium]|nr:hypothetical protein [Endozoicomonadaceae bacterium]